MTPTEASRRLAAFEREHEPGLVGLASHAALPVVLNAEIVHLLRINYFLDPPHTLPYTAEASLLLSSMCTEIDDGLYVIDPAIRDVLLATLVDAFTPARVRDVARLIWEYSERGAPWGERPGLAEAQQLTALNFIDPPRALGWLRRARRGEGALPINDDRWFVVLERDLTERAAAVDKAEGEAVFLGAKLPALTALRDVVMKLYDDPRAGLRVAAQVGLSLTGVSEQAGPSRAWQATLDAAWIAGRMPDLLEIITADLKQNPAWTKALAEYWFQLSPALKVVDGHFVSPPPEWQLLEQVRGEVERALSTLVVFGVQKTDGKAQTVGMGCLVGDYAVLTHKSMLEGEIVVDGRMRRDVRVFAEFAPDHLVWSGEPRSPTKTRLALTDAVVEPTTGLGILTSSPDRTGVPEPLRVMTQSPSELKGRKVYAMGYPAKDDHRIDKAVLTRAMGDEYGVLRIQPGEILGEDPSSGLINHNCFTAGGNSGSPLVDLRTGLVIGLHFAGFYEPGPRGFKRGQAIPLFRLAQNPLLIERGVFGAPAPPDVPPSPARERRTGRRDQVFINREAEQRTFLDMIAESRGQILFVEGAAGVGKTALLRRLAELAEKGGLRTVFLRAHAPSDPFRPEDFIRAMVQHLGLPAILETELTERQILRVFSEATGLTGSFAVFIDDVEAAVAEWLLPLIDMILRAGPPVLFVVAARSSAESRRLVTSTYRLVSLGPLDRKSVREWLATERVEGKDQIVDFVLEASKGDPSQLFKFVSALRRPQSRSTQNLGERLSTLDVMRPDSAVVFQDDPSETHGHFVLTRGSHTVAVPARFRMGTTPVTNEAFAEFIRAGGYVAQEFWPSGESRRRFTCKDGTPGPATWESASTANDLPRHPVAGVCYHEAIAFVAWLEGTVAAPENMHWCVPTEDMWEFAARGTSGLIYPWGQVFEPGRCNSREMNIGTTSEVGRFPGGRSPFGMDDMAGNVWEFVRADDQELWGCVLRGGSFTNNWDEIKASLRLVRVPRDHRPPDFGFRCALTSDIVAEPGSRSENQRPAQNAARSTVRPRRSSRRRNDPA